MTVGTGGAGRTRGKLPRMSKGPSTPTPAFALWLFVLWTAGSAMWFVSSWFPLAPLVALQHASGGWISVTLVASAGIGLVQLAIVFGPGRRAPAELGWRWRDVPAGIGAGVLLWALMQVPAVVAWLGGTGSPGIHPAWSAGLGIALGPLLAQVLGTALMEETAFRGFLWREFARRFGGRRRGAWAGAIVSQAAFALLHVPVRLSQGATLAELAPMVLGLFAVGLVFVAVYAATGNLFVAVAVHALGNAPTLVLAPHGAPTMWLLGGTLVLIALSIRVRHRRSRARSRGLLVASHAHR